MKYEQTNENASLISHTLKLVDDSTYLTETLEIADAFINNIAKIYDRKNIIFLQTIITRSYAFFKSKIKIRCKRL